jgi:NADPH:quinone reductase-like Zn-dependent oxidoreductase
VVVAADRVVSKPAAMSFEVAGGLDIAGRTAWASVRSLAPTEADTILVSAAAGGVGVLACQLVIRAGATVIGTASTENHDFLRGLGVIPVEYGDGLVDRVRAAAARPITGVLDNSGGPTIEAGIELGVPANRINTIAARAFVSEGGVTGIGGAAATLDDLEELALLIANGEIISPIDSVFPLESVAKAYERMMAGHLRGKIVLVTG